MSASPDAANVTAATTALPAAPPLDGGVAALEAAASAALAAFEHEAALHTEGYAFTGLAHTLDVAPGTTLPKRPDSALVEPLTPFHSLNPPPISLADLARAVLDRLVPHPSPGRVTGVLPARDRALVLLATVATCRRYDRLSGIRVSRAMSHRLVATALLVCLKVMMDCVVISNRSFARASGVPVRELRVLESSLLQAIGFAVPTLSQAAATATDDDGSGEGETPATPEADPDWARTIETAGAAANAALLAVTSPHPKAPPEQDSPDALNGSHASLRSASRKGSSCCIALASRASSMAAAAGGSTRRASNSVDYWSAAEFLASGDDEDADDAEGSDGTNDAANSPAPEEDAAAS